MERRASSPGHHAAGASQWFRTKANLMLRFAFLLCTGISREF